MALMVYSVPKWFLALRQARMAIVGGFPSVDNMIHIYTYLLFVLYIMPLIYKTNNIYLLLKLLLRVQVLCGSEVER